MSGFVNFSCVSDRGCRAGQEAQWVLLQIEQHPPVGHRTRGVVYCVYPNHAGYSISQN